MSLYPVQEKRSAPPRGAVPKRTMSKGREKEKERVGTPELENEEGAPFSFDDVMREPLLCGAFHKFLKESFCDESLLCYKEIEYFQSRCQTLNRLERFQDCKAIYDKFIEAGSEQEVNINDGIRIVCSQKIAEEEQYVFAHRKSLEKVNSEAGEGGLFEDTFQEILTALRLLMANDSYMKFVTSPLYEEGSQLVRRLHSIGVHVADDNDNFTDEEWTILMTGAEQVSLRAGTPLVTQGQFNKYFFKLVSGALRVDKVQPSGESITLNVLKKKGTVLCEMSIVNRLPTSASIIAETDAVVQKMKASFITNFFLTTANGPQLGVRFYKRLGRTLCMILCQITTMEPKSVYSTQRKTISEIISEHRTKESITVSPDASPRSRRKNSSPRLASASTAELEGGLKKKDIQSFKHRFPRVELTEPLLAVFECWFEKSLSRKGTLYISSNSLFLYSSVFGQKSRETISMSEVRSVDRTGSILVVQAAKRHAFRFEKVEMRDKAVNLLDSLIAALGTEEKPPEPEPKMKLKSATKDDTARIELNINEWDMLVARTNDSKCVFTYAKGDVILREGDTHKPHLFQICSGKCRVEKAVPNPRPGEPASLVLTTLGEGEVFGEIMFLTGSSPTASVIADEDNVQLYVVDSDLIASKLFATEPAVVVRFYAHLCSTIGSRIVEREREGWSRFQPSSQAAAEPSPGSTPGEIQRRKQQELFRRANPELTIGVKRPGKSSFQDYWVTLNGELGVVRLFRSKGSKCVEAVDLLERCVLKTDNKEISLHGADTTHVFRFPDVRTGDEWMSAVHQSAIDLQTKTLAKFREKLVCSVPNHNTTYSAATKKGVMRVQNMQLSRKKITDEQWETCFVVLALEHLYFFETQDDARKWNNCKQQVNVLFGFTKAYDSQSAAQRVIQIISDKASMLLACRTPEEREEWLRAIVSSKNQLQESFITDARKHRAQVLA